MVSDGREEKERRPGLLGRFRRDRDGAAALEFAILVVPFLMLMFATFETFLAFSGEQLMANAVETMARKIRTGEVTFGQGKPTDVTEAEFRQMFCDEISILRMCSATEAVTPEKLYLDVRQFANFADMPRDVPKVSTADYSDLDTSGFAFSPGGANSKNMLRAYYRWQVMTDLVRPYITNIRPANKPVPTDFLIVQTAAFENEDYDD
ncbi:MAG: pilus assembly protein [Rhizobiaceae bacterium]|nr:pilus assembly protein [Rhizobiaceae bacterium]